MTKKFVLLIALFFPMLGQSAPLSEPTSLREVMPLDALGYVRIPNPWGFFSYPKDNVLKGTLKHDQHVQQIQNLETAVYQNILTKAGALTPPALAVFIHHLRSPIEAIFLLPEQAPPALVNVLISAKLNLTSIDEFNNFLKAQIAQTPSLSIIQKVSADGYAVLMAGYLPIFIHYDINTQTLNMMGGLAANQDIFQHTIASLVPVKQHPMYEMENRIDSSHQGFFKWVNLEKVLPLFQANIPPKVALDMHRWGLLNLRAAALGWGFADGKGRLSIMIDAPRAGYREFFPAIGNNLSITASGKPGTVVSLSIPAGVWLKGIEKIAQTEAAPEELEVYQSIKELFKKELGFSIEDALSAFGPEFLFFTDEVGEFAAIRIGDENKLHKILTFLVKNYGLSYKTRLVNEKTYHHLVIPASSLEDSPQKQQRIKKPESEGEAFFSELFGKLNTHIYWVEEEGYLIFAQVPQLLFDRQRNQKRVGIQQWLKQAQRQDSQSSLFLISTTFSDTPRQLYYVYLQSLTWLAELANAKIDLFLLPSAMELKLPKNGTYGVQLDISDSLLSLAFTFENNPLEFMLSADNMAGVAVIGILAAVAIPAYNDYLISVKVSEGAILLSAIKAPAIEFFAYFDRLPEVDEIGAVTSNQYAQNLSLLYTKNGYSIEFHDPAISGKLILLYDEYSGIWRCTSDGIDEKYLPSVCR